MAKHTVKQGECISSIADKYGFFPDTLWNLAENAQLKRKRKDPNVLFPGDELFIPDKDEKTETGATEKKHRFRKKNVPVYLNLRLIDLDEKPRCGLKYIMAIDGDFQEGTTDKEGCIHAVISPGANRALLKVFPNKRQNKDVDNQVYSGPEPEEVEDQQDYEEYEINLGCLDPIDEVKGVQERLKNLGYLLEIKGQEQDEEFKEALLFFQDKHQLQKTGRVDPDTVRKLKEISGI